MRLNTIRKNQSKLKMKNKQISKKDNQQESKLKIFLRGNKQTNSTNISNFFKNSNSFFFFFEIFNLNDEETKFNELLMSVKKEKWSWV